jgi:hypothetical protein
LAFLIVGDCDHKVEFSSLLLRTFGVGDGRMQRCIPPARAKSQALWHFSVVCEGIYVEDKRKIEVSDGKKIAGDRGRQPLQRQAVSEQNLS